MLTGNSLHPSVVSKPSPRVNHYVAWLLRSIPEIKILNSLTHYHTISHFDALKIYSCEKHCKKRGIAWDKQFLFFSQCFLPYKILIFHFKCTLICCLQFVLIWTSKILSSGNRLTFSQQTKF